MSIKRAPRINIRWFVESHLVYNVLKTFIMFCTIPYVANKPLFKIVICRHVKLFLTILNVLILTQLPY